jgi:hypothetical protein
MPKKVRIEKVGFTTKTTEYYTENPDVKRVVSFYASNITIDKDELFVERGVKFTLSEIEDNYGVTTVEQLVDELRIRKMFMPIENEDDTGFITLIAPITSTQVQNSLLVGKESIDLVVVANGVDQNPENYNSETGTFDFNVISGDKLTIFYTN